jgi:hypothetical protein
MPKRGNANGNIQLLPTALLQLGQGQIGLGLDPAPQSAIMGRQAGTPMAANLLGQTLAGSAMRVPESFNTLAADTKTLGHLASAFTTFPRRNNPCPQILA